MKKSFRTLHFYLCFRFSQIDKLNSKEPLVKTLISKKETNVAVQPGQKYVSFTQIYSKENQTCTEEILFFTGNVQFEHQGAMLTARPSDFLRKENFAKAIGNVLLVTSDGNRITSNEMGMTEILS